MSDTRRKQILEALDESLVDALAFAQEAEDFVAMLATLQHRSRRSLMADLETMERGAGN